MSIQWKKRVAVALVGLVVAVAVAPSVHGWYAEFWIDDLAAREDQLSDSQVAEEVAAFVASAADAGIRVSVQIKDATGTPVTQTVREGTAPFDATVTFSKGGWTQSFALRFSDADSALGLLLE